jgi:hypothetical protein
MGKQLTIQKAEARFPEMVKGKTWKGSRFKYEFICVDHGIYKQTFNSHDNGTGCPRCGSLVKGAYHRLTTKEFIKKAREVHGTRYRYSKVLYGKNNRAKVIIICKEHGEFQQAPDSHLQGQGCLKCAHQATSDRGRKSLKQFIKDAKKVHGNLYGYSKVKYTNCKAKVTITCKEHGEFKQTPDNHVQDRGCLKCKGFFSTDTKSFIEEARKVHGDRYGYQKVKYISAKCKVTIVCKEHGEFQQRPSSHLTCKGCPACKAQACRDRMLSTLEYFIKRARKVHGNLYDYSKSKYTGTEVKLAIICGKHGEFEQQPKNHLQGQGCPICKTSQGEKKVREVLEKLRVPFGHQFRIPECHNARSLPFDFDVWLNGKPHLIEFQGRQHYDAERFFKGVKALKLLQHRDRIKKQFCKKNRIPLLIIPYWEQKIEGVVRKFLVKNA